MPSAILSALIMSLATVLAAVDTAFGTDFAQNTVVYLNEGAKFIVEGIEKILFGIFN